MCDKCIEIDRKIERHKRVAESTHQKSRDLISGVIRKLEQQKNALHREWQD